MPEIRVDMSALEFLKESQRMSIEDTDSFLEFVSLSKYGEEAPAAKVAYMMDWCDKHPKRCGKTRMHDFFEKYPSAPHGRDGTPEACCKQLGYTKACRMTNKATSVGSLCGEAGYCEASSELCRKCWHELLEG